MSRFLPLLPLMLWFGWASHPLRQVDVGLGAVDGSLVYLTGLLAIVAVAVGAGRRAARGGGGATRFYRLLSAARFVALAWHAAGLFALGWGTVVYGGLRLVWPGFGPVVEVPGLLVGTAPVLLAWAGLRWAQYPVDVRQREGSVLLRINDGLPVHASPPLGAYLSSTLRLSLGFTLAPVLAVMAVRDAVGLATWAAGVAPGGWPEAAATFGSTAAVFVLAPELLRRVLSTRPLPAGPLRDRLESAGARAGFRCRDLLVWRTNHAMGNAAVMGLVAPVRYVLLSDLLIESMGDAQIEAVFAHEVGHVRHGHMGWIVALMAGLLLALAGPGDWLSRRAVSTSAEWLPSVSTAAVEWAVAGGLVAAAVLAFGLVSRRFERQADVYAARTVGAADASGRPAVAPGGADLFASALARVAAINGVPLRRPKRQRNRRRWSGVVASPRVTYWLDLAADLGRDYLHGSLWDRMKYLQALAADPANTRRFDRAQARLRLGIAALVVGSAACLLLLP